MAQKQWKALVPIYAPLQLITVIIMHNHHNHEMEWNPKIILYIQYPSSLR